MSADGMVIGIDLGTTNSEVAAFLDGRVQVLGSERTRILPSCVGLSPSGELLIGEPARNQLVVYPERTVRSIKRRMGSEETVTLGEQRFTPQEISALILRELAGRASRALGCKVERAVITVPAYFSDAQRAATREAGRLAGLRVERILNEPTAASLAYGFGDGGRRTLMVYDLGGGTFDVSVITVEDDVTEVLASHGNNLLGGDDFDRLLFDRLLEAFREDHGLELGEDQLQARARLWRAAEEAKRGLSEAPYATVREESLLNVDGEPLHLELELSRAEYEGMIHTLLESTLDSVSRALDDAGKAPGDLDAILLVGGSTRTPLVWKLIEERAGFPPRQEVHPDLCVALGAGVLASRLAGREVERVLIDVSPYSFGPSYLGERDGLPYPHCYKPIIRRNTPLPVTRTEPYCTAHDFQTEVEIDVYQGDDPDALKNLLVGHFCVEGLSEVPQGNEILCRMGLDLDGCLQVTAIEKCTGLSKGISISGALEQKSEAELAEARERLEALLARQGEGSGAEDGAATDGGESGAAGGDAGTEDAGVREDGADSGALPRLRTEVAAGISGRREHEARDLLGRSRALLDAMHQEDREEAIELNARVEAALAGRDAAALGEAVDELEQLVFFVEGR